MLAENGDVEKNTQPKTDVEKVISGYAGEKSSNQFKSNMKTLDNYYETLNKKLHNDKKQSSSGNPTTQNNKTLLNRVEFGQLDNNNPEQNTEKNMLQPLGDTQLLDLMKQAGVDKDNQENEKKPEKIKIRVFRDPFSLTPTLTGGGRIIEDSLPFAQKTFSEKMPTMVLKGVVVKPDGSRVALLQVGGEVTYMVKENERVGLSALGLKMVIHIQEIHDNTIIVEPGEISTGQENEVIVVR